jgi:carboxyl-terminal processing protease
VSAGRIAALTAALLATLAAGLWLGGHPSRMPPPLRDIFVNDSVGLTAEATELIEDNYYRPVQGGSLSDGSLRGMVRELRQRNHDRFSDYYSAASLRRFNEEISGRFSGIGIAVTPVRSGLRASHVFRRSPAERAGIEVGDVIVSVDGRSLHGMGTEAATGLIKGPDGTDVVLGVVQPPRPRPSRLRLTREEISLPVVTSRVKEVDGRTLGYIRLSTFSEGVHAYLARAVKKVEAKGAEGMVLDLRSNGGGLLQEAVLSASIFLPEGEVVVTTDSRTQGHAIYKTRGGNLPRRPLVVLVDGNTASAAEILTAALADDGGAEVVGEQTYGKGVFQQELGLSNGGALKLTVGEYFTPKGVNLAGDGIVPDVRARDLPGTAADEALERAYGVLATLREPG